MVAFTDEILEFVADHAPDNAAWLARGLDTQIEYTDGQYRVYNEDGTAKDYSPRARADWVRVGCNGFDLKDKLAHYITFEFDFGHGAVEITEQQREWLVRTLGPKCDIVRSTGGKGLHCRARLSTPVPCNTRKQYTRICKAGVRWLEKQTGEKFAHLVERAGPILWLGSVDQNELSFLPQTDCPGSVSIPSGGLVLDEPEVPTGNVGTAVSRMLGVPVKDQRDSSSRVYKYGCIAAEEGLSDEQYVTAVRVVEQQHPFLMPYSDADLLKRLEDAKATGIKPKTRSRLNPKGWASALQQDYTVDWLIPDLLASGMPGIIGGPYKACKTLVGLDACLSLAYGCDFLGRFPAEQSNVMLFTGESAMGILCERGRLMMEAKGITEPDDSSFLIDNVVPRLDQPLSELEKLLRDNGTKVLIIDPVFKAMGGAEMNVGFSVYEKLNPITDLCQSLGITLLLMHHAVKSSGKKFERLKLADLQWSGFAEWTRQTWLLSRRSEYKADGHHPLYLTLHNNANQGGDYCLDIDEGCPSLGRPACWNVRVTTSREQVVQELDAEFIQFTEEVKALEGDFTKTTLGKQLGKGRGTIDRLLPQLLEAGVIESVGPKKTRGQRYQLVHKEKHHETDH